MSRLPIDAAAEQRLAHHYRDYYKRLLARADIIARQRNGDSIQTGDFDEAHDLIEGRGRRAQFTLAAAGMAGGAGLSGLVQNLLDGKPMNYLAVFAFLMLFGLLLGLKAVSK